MDNEERKMEWQSYSHPISDIRDWSNDSRLELRPDFQRNEVWTSAAQIMLIDTILKGIPIPKIYIKTKLENEKTYRVVIDGQQRLTAILKFVRNEITLKEPYKGEYIGCTFSQLPSEVHNDFLRYKIDINEIYNPTDAQIRDLYSRVNKYTVQLNKQELRRADFPGDFISLSESLSELPFFADNGIFTVKQRRRMLDVEYVEELLTIVMRGIQDKKDYLDEVCESYMHLENKEDVRNSFLGIIEDISNIFDIDTYPLKKTRFKQKSDFYSLFACIKELKSSASLVDDSALMTTVREKLSEMSREIGPQSNDKDYLEYATRCLSDANSMSNREWRTNFMKIHLAPLYGIEE